MKSTTTRITTDPTTGATVATFHEPSRAVGCVAFLFSMLVGAILATGGFVVALGITGVAGETTAFWYLSRASGMVVYLLLWGSVVWGLLLSSKIGQVRWRAAVLLEAHRFLSYVALGFALFHGLVLMGDRYFGFPLQAVLVPFASAYEPTLVAAGQIAFWLSVALSFSFAIRKHTGQRAWRVFHYTSFLAYALAFAHAAWLGSDSDLPWMQALYLVTGGIVLFLVYYRILSSRLAGAQSVAASEPRAAESRAGALHR